MNSLAHVEINVSDLKRSVAFWSLFLIELGWKKFDVNHPAVAGFRAPDHTNIFLVQTEQRFLVPSYHRKRAGLNHVAFRVESAEAVDQFTQFLNAHDIVPLYHAIPKDYSSEYAVERYYAIFFEDPDRIKLEVVYCK